MPAAIAKAALTVLAALYFPLSASAQTVPTSEASAQASSTSREVTTDDYNQRLGQLKQSLAGPAANSAADDYRIGPQDLLEISVFEAPELNCTVRVSASGEISLPLLGAVQAAGATPKALEFVLQELLRRKLYEGSPRECLHERDAEPPRVGVRCSQEARGIPN